MANWWDNLVAGLDEGTREGKFGFTPQYDQFRPGFTNAVAATQKSARMQPTQYTPEMTAAADKQARDLFDLGGAGTLQNRIMGEMQNQVSAASEGPSFDEQRQAYIMGVLGQAYPGGGGPSLGGFDTLLADFDSRETALGGRKAENESFISGIIEAARTRGTDAQGRIQGRYDEMGAAASDQRAAEINAIQNSELTRLAQRNAARAALGVDGGADIASAENESAGAGISAAGSIAARDAQIQQSIETQQSSNQLAGLDPMQLMANRQLSNSYEDRLAEIASGRAGVMAQRAQAQASYRAPSPSISEILAVQDSANQMFDPGGEAPDVSGTGLQIVQQYAQADPRNAQLYGAILQDLPGVMSQYGLSDTGKNMDPTELANAIIAVRPDYGDAYLFIRDLVGSGN
jgi:hypothetical protein